MIRKDRGFQGVFFLAKLCDAEDSVFFRLHRMIKREDTDKKPSITELTFQEEEGMLIGS